MAGKQTSKPVQEKPAEAPLASGEKIPRGFLTPTNEMLKAEMAKPKNENKKKNAFLG
ncbi:MAG: hypothetical protein NTV88_03520 [Candidatus Micrarchaeota archaeon]|nr:hypothetical protein [Candidatus Micrarchaeota archaeon]